MGIIQNFTMSKTFLLIFLFTLIGLFEIRGDSCENFKCSECGAFDTTALFPFIDCGTSCGLCALCYLTYVPQCKWCDGNCESNCKRGEKKCRDWCKGGRKMC